MTDADFKPMTWRKPRDRVQILGVAFSKMARDTVLALLEEGPYIEEKLITGYSIYIPFADRDSDMPLRLPARAINFLRTHRIIEDPRDTLPIDDNGPSGWFTPLGIATAYRLFPEKVVQHLAISHRGKK